MGGEDTRRHREHTIAENERRYGAEARRRYGDDAVDAANERRLALTDEEWDEAETLESAIISALRQAMETGDTEGAAARELCRMHARWIRLMWQEGAYNTASHAGLARLYTADDRFRAYYDSRAGAGAADFLSKALLSYLGSA